MRAKRWPLASLSRALLGLTPSRRPFSGVAVKKVTRSNFDAALEELRGVVRDSDFVALDLEMSGLARAPWRDSSPLDDPHVQYLKFRDSALNFAAPQIGLCPFRWDASRDTFVARPYNFYLFPRPDIGVDGSSFEFLCQTSSLEFLAKHQFDFNAWIYEGITYLSRAEESEAHNAFLLSRDDTAGSANTFRESIELPLVRAADVFFTERMKNKFAEWRNGILKGCIVEENPNVSRNQFQTVFFKMRPAVLLDDFSSHQHKLIQGVIRTHFTDLVYIHSSAFQRRMVVYTAADDDKALLMKEVWEDFRKTTKERLKSAVGFRHIIDLLSAEKKLIVGHSCILDIVHIYDKFLGPLPSTLTEFAQSFHRFFPHVIDTKHILESCEIFQHLVGKRGCRSLSSVFARLCPDISAHSNLPSHQLVKIEVPEEGTGPWNSGAKHEAGYDAFMTGSVFVQACAYMDIDFKLLSQPLDLSEHEKLQKYKNLVCLNRRNATVIDLKTGAESPPVIEVKKLGYQKIDSTCIILLWGFSPKIKPSDLKQCLTKVYGPDSITSVFYLDETAALVQFSNQELVERFLCLKDSLEGSKNVISVLHPLAMLLQGGKTHAATYIAYVEICSSPISKFRFTDQAESVGITGLTKFETGDLEGNQINVNRSMSSMHGTIENISKETNKDGATQSSFPPGSKAHLSFKLLLDSLYDSTESLQAKHRWKTNYD